MKKLSLLMSHLLGLGIGYAWLAPGVMSVMAARCTCGAGVALGWSWTGVSVKGYNNIVPAEM